MGVVVNAINHVPKSSNITFDKHENDPIKKRMKIKCVQDCN